MTREVHEIPVQATVIAQAVTVDFHIHIGPAEGGHQSFRRGERAGLVVPQEMPDERSFAIPRQGDEARVGEVPGFSRAFEMQIREVPTERLIGGPVGAEHRQVGAVRQIQCRADHGLDAAVDRSLVRAGGAVESPVIGEGDRRVAELRGAEN